MEQSLKYIQCESYEDFKTFLYKHNQLPINWIMVGYSLVKDADIIFLEHKKKMDFIISELEKQGFDFDAANATGIEYCVNKVLSENNSFFPDFYSFYLLASLALENIFKGIMLGYNPTYLNFDRCPRIIVTHDLKKLSEYTKLYFLPEENEFLNKCSNLFTSYARYPIKSKLNIKDLYLGRDDGCKILYDYRNGEFIYDKELFDAILDKLLPIIKEINEESYFDYIIE